MSPPLSINFSLTDGTQNVSGKYKSTLRVLYRDGNEIKTVDYLQYYEDSNAKTAHFHSYFPSLSTTTKRDFMIDLGDGKINNIIEIETELIDKECNLFKINSLYFNKTKVVVEKVAMQDIYVFALN